MRRRADSLVALGALLLVVVLVLPAVAWDGRPFGHRGYVGMPWAPSPVPYFSAPLPYGSRFYYPPGIPLTYQEPSSGTTYCLSQQTGVYYICGYSPEATYRVLPAALPPLGAERLPTPSGVLIFRLQQNAEAAVDGVPVGLSEGLGVTSVIPGMHRIVVRAPGAETEHTVTVNPHSIFTVTPSGVVPTAP